VSITADPTPGENAVDLEGSRSHACWSVQGGDWCDELPAELAALLAPPVVVSAEAITPPGRRTTQRNSTRPAAYGPWHVVPEDTHPSRVLTRRHRRPSRPA
jgi:hypothetical protein